MQQALRIDLGGIPRGRYTRTMEICQRLAGADPDNTQHQCDVIGGADALQRGCSNRRAILPRPTIGQKHIRRLRR